MAKNHIITTNAPLMALGLDKNAADTLQAQLFKQISDIILSGRAKPGTRLPSSRAMAADLNVSRNTVTNVFDRLMSEGYTQGRIGSATYVSKDLPQKLLGRRRDMKSKSGGVPVDDKMLQGHLSLQAKRVLQIALINNENVGQHTLRPGHADIARFPFGEWNRLSQKFWRHPPKQHLLFPDVGGYPPLRQEIAKFLTAERGLNCRPEQIIVTSGSQQALDMTVRLLVNAKQKVWIENPCYGGLKAAFQAVDAELVPVEVDEQGLVVSNGVEWAGDAVMAAVTPSHHYPLGVVMSLPRRLEILDWAKTHNAWILEDDYDSEFRYSGRPLSSLQGLDDHGRVIYAGTFSKIMFPAMRLGYLVVPENLLASFLKFSSILYGDSPLAFQPTLAAFMENGYFAAHVRRMRVIYKQRQQWMIDAVERHLSNFLKVETDPAGMHLLANLVYDNGLPSSVSDKDLSAAAAMSGLSVMALSDMYDGYKTEASGHDSVKQGLVLGYGGICEDEINKALEKLHWAWQPFIKTS